MTKEEAVKKAWAEFYTNKVNENGWLDIKPQQYSNDELFDRLKFNSEKHSIRPKSLSGIENNNGWIKIESQSDLPKKTGGIYWVMKKEYDYPIVERFYNHDANHWFENFTHYKSIEKPKKPIY